MSINLRIYYIVSALMSFQMAINKNKFPRIIRSRDQSRAYGRLALMMLTLPYIACASQSFAAASYFNFEFTSNDSKIAGVLTANPSGPGKYDVTGISGYILGLNGAGNIGNLLYPGQFPAYANTNTLLIYPKDPSYFNLGGIAFTNLSNTYSYNIYSDIIGDYLWVADNPYSGFDRFYGTTTVVSELPEIDGTALPKGIFIIIASFLILFRTGRRTKPSSHAA